MFDIILLNAVFIVVPVLVYLLYIVYENVIGKKGNDLFLTFAIFTSLYFIIKYSTYFDYPVDIINILLLLSLLKNKKKTSITLGIFIAIYFGLMNDYSMALTIVEYALQLLLYFVIFKDLKLEYKVSIFALIEIIFGIIYGYYNFLYIIVSNVIYASIGYFVYIAMTMTERVIDVYGTIRVVEYEKEFRDSLFQITHEIKNPIAVCKGYLDMMDVNNSRQVNKYIPIIKQEIDRTLTLMNDYLNLTKLTVNKSVIDISLLLDDVCNAVEALLIGKNIHFMFDIVDDEIFINGDYDRLKQVFINLVKNSVESIDNSKIGVIKLKMTVNKKVVITLTDNGKGMDKNTLQKVGTAFYTTKDKGTGLGVKLSMEIIELHNGKIKYSSKLNEGTTVRIELPLYEEI